MVAFARRPRAAMYVAVLITATLVSIIGMCALAASRVQFRTAESGNEVVSARLAAQSAIELARFLIESDASWRTHYTHDTWAPSVALGRAVLDFKLVDETNLDLTADETAPVWLYGRGTVGDAVRTYRVLLEVLGPTSKGLVSNGGFESGLTGWWESGDCDLEVYNDDPHGGSAYCWVKNRDYNDAGPRQTLETELVDGQLYQAEVWVKMKDSSEDVWLGLMVRTRFGWFSYSIAQQRVGTSWTKVSGSITPNWSSMAEQVVLKVKTNWSTQEFMVDDFVLAEAGSSGSTVVPVAGTWERVVDALALEEPVKDPNSEPVIKGLGK